MEEGVIWFGLAIFAFVGDARFVVVAASAAGVVFLTTCHWWQFEGVLYGNEIILGEG